MRKEMRISVKQNMNQLQPNSVNTVTEGAMASVPMNQLQPNSVNTVTKGAMASVPINGVSVLKHSRPQSPSFLGHVVRKRGALEAAVTGSQKISDIRSRMCKSYKYHCSCS